MIQSINGWIRKGTVADNSGLLRGLSKKLIYFRLYEYGLDVRVLKAMGSTRNMILIVFIDEPK